MVLSLKHTWLCLAFLFVTLHLYTTEAKSLRSRRRTAELFNPENLSEAEQEDFVVENFMEADNFIDDETEEAEKIEIEDQEEVALLLKDIDEEEVVDPDDPENKQEEDGFDERFQFIDVMDIEDEDEEEAALLAQSFVEDQEEETPSSRKLMPGDHHEMKPGTHCDMMFQPLTCNNKIEGANCASKSLSSLIESTQPGDTVTVPCGECIHIDTTDGSTLDFPYGLRIEGKLYVPPEASVTLRTKFVLVFGIFKIDVPAVANKVKVHLYGDDEIQFVPPIQNAQACKDGHCKAGKKPIVVAGGKLDITGYDTTCPAWEKLADVSSSNQIEPAAEEIPSGCSTNRFEGRNRLKYQEGTKSWWWGWANPVTITSPGAGGTGYALKAYNRNRWVRGMHPNFLDRKCFTEGSTWRFTFKTRMYNEASGAPIKCDPSVPNTVGCPFVRLHTMHSSGARHRFTNIRDTSMVWDQVNADTWNEFSTTFTMPASLRKDIILFRPILVGGPAKSVLEIDDIELVPDVPPPPMDAIVVSQKAAECWGTPGNEILITSHTRFNRDHQVVTVAGSDPSTGTIYLTKEIKKPITMKDDPDFAVEVALLTRPVSFEADDDMDNDLIGGHLIFIHTPHAQHLEGVEIKNFGQQGNLGRYPVHFHMCENVEGSLVKKNVVRQSNQRCYVVHGSHNVTMEENVAYDTFGHCFFLEDGGEMHNTFRGNLGAGIKRSTHLVKSGRTETDRSPSVFWISNPVNDFYDNVAAGSDVHGYWFETHRTVRGPSSYQTPKLNPLTSNLGEFKGNSVHSSHHFAFTVYPPGWQPTGQALIEDLKVYRNAGDGLFLHASRNLKFTNALIADNGKRGIRINRADDVIFEDTRVIGLTKGTEKPVWCSHRPGLYGMSIHPTKLQMWSNKALGTTLKNVTFSRFLPEETHCGDSTAIITEGMQIFTPVYAAPHYFEDVIIQDGVQKINACPSLNSKEGELDDFAIEDSTASFSPTGEPGFLVSPKLTELAGVECISTSNGCLDWCENTCLRTVNVMASSADRWEGLSMVVTAADGKTMAIERNLNRGSTKWPFNHATYGTALPAGEFTVHFVDESGMTVYPDYVIPEFLPPPKCENHIKEGDVIVLEPGPFESRCDELIKNGDFSDGIEGWQDIRSGITWDINAKALKSTSRTNHHADSVVYPIDTSCLVEGGLWELELSYKLVDLSGNIAPACTHGLSCPYVDMQYSHWTNKGGFKNSWQGLGSTVDYMYNGEKNIIKNTFKISSHGASAEKAFINLRRGIGQYIIDSARITKIYTQAPSDAPSPAPSISDAPTSAPTGICSNNFAKDNYQTGSSQGWHGWANKVGVEAPGAGGQGYALKAYDRVRWEHDRNRWVRGVHPGLISTACATEGRVWRMSFKAKMYDEDSGEGYATCSKLGCPIIRIHTMQDKKSHNFFNVFDNKMAQNWKQDDWNQFETTFTFTDQVVGDNLTLLRPIFCGGPKNSILLIDDIILQPI